MRDDRELIARNREIWEPKYGRPLSDDELREIHRNLTGFFRVLLDWHEKGYATRSAPALNAPSRGPA